MLHSHLSTQKAKEKKTLFSEPPRTPKRKQTQKPKMQENGGGLQGCVLKNWESGDSERDRVRKKN